MIIFIVVIAITCLHGAYTMCLQDTTLLIAKKLSPLMEESFLGSPLARNIQNAITPKRQNINNQIFFALLIISVIATFIILKWYFCFLTIIFVLSIITPLKKLFPRPGASHYVSIIRTDMVRRLDVYRTNNDSEKTELMIFLLGKFDEEIQNG